MNHSRKSDKIRALSILNRITNASIFIESQDPRKQTKFQRTKFKRNELKILNHQHSTQDLFNQAGYCCYIIKLAIISAKKTGCTKRELIIRMKAILERFPELKLNAFRVAINNAVQLELENQLMYPLDDENLRIMWKHRISKYKYLQPN